MQSWTLDSAGAWTLTLQPPATSAGHHPVSTAAVAGTLARGEEIKAFGIDSAVVLNDHQVRLFTTLPQDTVLRSLADPVFTVWQGLAPQDPKYGSGVVVPGDRGQPPIRLRLPPLDDARDALDRGADLIVTREPALLEYAARRPEFTVQPLPWSRTYVLIDPASAQPLGAVTSEAERQSLARDAVHADARAAEPPFWWLESSCAANPGAGTEFPSMSDRIVYLRSDAVARGLAERLVALAGPATRLRAAGLEGPELQTALRDGSERAYVVSLPKQTLQPCGELGGLPADARIRPLIETRAHAIVRRGAPPLTVEWDGTIRVVRP